MTEFNYNFEDDKEFLKDRLLDAENTIADLTAKLEWAHQEISALNNELQDAHREMRSIYNELQYSQYNNNSDRYEY